MTGLYSKAVANELEVMIPDLGWSRAILVVSIFVPLYLALNYHMKLYPADRVSII